MAREISTLLHARYIVFKERVNEYLDEIKNNYKKKAVILPGLLFKPDG